MSRKALALAVLGAPLLPCLVGQAAPEERLANDVLSAIRSISSHPWTLSEWKGLHGSERIDFAHYDTAADSYEVELTNQWCATSVAEMAAGTSRAASFYVPEVTPGSLLPLPERQDRVLAGRCTLGAIEFATAGQQAAVGIAGKLTAAWGAPLRPDRKIRTRDLQLAGSGLWKDVSMWPRGTVSVWLAWTDLNSGNTLGLRTIVYIVRERPRDFDLFTAGFDTRAAALKLADLGPGLAADITPPANGVLGVTTAAARLSRWLEAADGLTAERRAAALLAADSFVGCVRAGGGKPDPLVALGATFGQGCPQDGPSYQGTLRKQAEGLDPHGPAGALAALASLQSPCMLAGSGPWPERVLVQGQKALQQFPAGPWSPWMHFALARAHEVKLSFSVPPGEADIGVIHHLTTAQARQERSLAIAEYERFLQDQRDSPPAVFAWQEAWRLLAGLLPSPTHFGCGCE